MPFGAPKTNRPEQLLLSGGFGVKNPAWIGNLWVGITFCASVRQNAVFCIRCAFPSCGPSHLGHVLQLTRLPKVKAWPACGRFMA